MNKAKKIDPSRATPQAPSALRVGTRSRAAEPAPPKPGADAAGGDPDDDDEGDDDPDALAEHEPLRADAEAKHMAAAEAWKACAGTDSASAHQAAMDAEDDATTAGAAAKSGSMKVLGIDPPPDSQPAPAPPAPGAARALGALAGPTAKAQQELAGLAAWATEALGKLGAKTLAGGSAKLDLALAALAKLPKIEAREKAQAVIARLDAALHAGMPRAKAFVINADDTLGAPLPVWAKLDLVALDEVLTAQGYPAGAPVARSTMIIASADGGGEAGLAARAAVAGVDIETRRRAEQNVNRSQQENSR